MTTPTPKLDAMRVAEVIIADFSARRDEPADRLRAELVARVEAEALKYIAAQLARGMSERRAARFRNVLAHHTRRALDRPKPPRWATGAIGPLQLGRVRRL